MALSNTEIRYYDGNVLRLPADKRKEYHAQVDRLITELCKHVRDKTEIKITKVVKAGSFAKYTILRKTVRGPRRRRRGVLHLGPGYQPRNAEEHQ